MVTVTARLPWLCQDPIITCRSSYYAVLSRPLPDPGLSASASGWVPIRASQLRRFRTSPSCPLNASLPRSFLPGQFTPKRLYIGIDTDIWTDPLTGEVWLSWSSDDNVAMTAGLSVQAIGISRLDPNTLEIACEPNNLIMPVTNPLTFGSGPTSFYCTKMGVPGCSGWTAKAGGRFVYEGQALMRRKGWVYLFYSASVWSSTNYGVSWLAAPSVRELVDGSPTRLEGQYVVPYDAGLERHTFGHGRPILGADGSTWYFSFHHLAPKSGAGPRRAFLAPITFVDIGDGRGDVWVQPILPPVDRNANRMLLDDESSGGGAGGDTTGDTGAGAAGDGGGGGQRPQGNGAATPACPPSGELRWEVRAAGAGSPQWAVPPAVSVSSGGGDRAEVSGLQRGDSVLVSVARAAGANGTAGTADEQVRARRS